MMMLVLCAENAISDPIRQVNILLVLSSDSQLHQEIANTSKELLLKQCNHNPACKNIKPNFTSVLATELAASARQLRDQDLVITFGKRAATLLEKYRDSFGQVKVLHSLIPKETGSAMLQESLGKNQYVLLLDQPIYRQLRLIRQMFPDRRRLGVLLSQNKQGYRNELQEAAIANDLELELALVHDTADTGSLLSELVKKVDLFLIIPDKSIYNRNTIKEILLTGYFHSKAFIGYSNSLTRSGALASIVTGKDTIAEDVAQLVLGLILRPNAVRHINYPVSYQISINQNVAESLGITIPEAILELEKTLVIE
ncbi:MAG: ABC transporter substrate binding protein [Chromatiales bacterium]